jgi:iron complex outermembrane receptor protein
MRRWASTVVFTFLVLAAVARAAPSLEQSEALPAPSADELSSMSLEDLMNVEVTSVSRTKQKVADAPAAITVITSDDIRRSGLTSIPEILRLSPGLDVARVNANTWAISARGFTDVYANKLLVLMDGRTVYTPLFSGVYWDAQDYVLADLERIEVIRGPGATLWGANAVNGVINITTKSARDTQGLYVTGLGGNLEQSGAVRYGGQLGENTYYRVYGKFQDTENFVNAAGDDTQDGWEGERGGFRLDAYTTPKDVITFQGDGYRNLVGTPLRAPNFTPPTFAALDHGTVDHYGGNILGRWTHTISPDSDFSVQLYYDRVVRDDVAAGYTLDTFDFDFQHRFPLGQRQEIIWGAGYRFMVDSIHNSGLVTIEPRHRDDYLASAFVQDRITVAPDKLFVYVGSKFEQNSYSDFEIEPGVRVLWTPTEKQSVWASVSRAVRTPSRVEQDARFVLTRMLGPGGVPLSVDALGSNGFESEKLLAYEMGYRLQPTQALTLDVAAFLNVYDDLRTFEQGAPIPDPAAPGQLLVPATADNLLKGEGYGVELAANWKVSNEWRVGASYTFLQMNLHRVDGSNDAGSEQQENASPRNKAQLHSYYDITRNLQVNGALYWTEGIGSQSTPPGAGIPGYLRLDVGLTWRPADGLELSVFGQNLLDDRHPEFSNRLYEVSSEVPRSIYGQLTWRY